MNLIEMCLGHLCPNCKDFWKHQVGKPAVGFACSNQLTMMFCPICLYGGGGPGKDNEASSKDEKAA